MRDLEDVRYLTGVAPIIYIQQGGLKRVEKKLTTPYEWCAIIYRGQKWSAHALAFWPLIILLDFFFSFPLYPSSLVLFHRIQTRNVQCVRIKMSEGNQEKRHSLALATDF